MHIVKLDLEQGLIFLDSISFMLNNEGVFNEAIKKLCAPPTENSLGSKQFRLLEKVSVYGRPADCVIEVLEGKVSRIAFLFDLIKFFVSNVLESKILKSCEQSSGVKFVSDHPTTAFVQLEWGKAEFFYDARQGDLSLNFIRKKNSEEKAP